MKLVIQFNGHKINETVGNLVRVSMEADSYERVDHIINYNINII